jgi:homogentisate 1,2-dioxygenase
MTNASLSDLRYQSGFGNEYASEAVAGALPQGRNSPQRAPLALYAELLSGTAFTAPRHQNRRSWLYRRQPSVVCGRYQPYAQAHWTTGADREIALAPEPLRWNPMPLDGAETAQADFVDGMHTLAANGDAQAQVGIGALMYLANRSMTRRAFVNADGELLIVPQQGCLRITTEMGVLAVKPGEIALVPRGVVFKVALPDSDAGQGASRATSARTTEPSSTCPSWARSAPTVWPTRATSRPRWRLSSLTPARTNSSRSTRAASGPRRCSTRPSTSSPGTATWRR